MKNYLIIINSLLLEAFGIQYYNKLWPLATTNHIQHLAERVLARNSANKTKI